MEHLYLMELVRSEDDDAYKITTYGVWISSFQDIIHWEEVKKGKVLTIKHLEDLEFTENCEVVDLRPRYKKK